MQALRMLRSGLIWGMENIFTQTMHYCVEISEMALNKPAQKAEAGWLHLCCFPSGLISPANRLNQPAQSSTTPHMALLFIWLSKSQIGSAAWKSVVHKGVHLLLHIKSVRYRATVKIKLFIEGNTAWRVEFLLRENGKFHKQCHTMKCVENPIGRNFSPVVWLLLPCPPMSSLHNRDLYHPRHKRKTWTWISHSVTGNTATTTTGKENIGMKAFRCLISEEAPGLLLHGRSCVPVALTVVPKARCGSGHTSIS